MSDLGKKEQSAIKILKMYRGDSPIELSYSGGKDSDVILALANIANINYRAIYKNTTIDPPGTVKHCKENGAEIVMPKDRFFNLIAQNGYPTMFSRHCCRILKEYKILDSAIQGIRRDESQRRAARYTDPIRCRNFSKTEHVNIFLPILDWTNKDVVDFINAHGIQCHPLYYPYGKFDVSKRLGCIGCPMAKQKGLYNFKQYPKMVKQWIKAGNLFLETHPGCKSSKRFNNGYEYFAAHLFDSLEYFKTVTNASLFGKENWKQRLEDFFRIDL